MTKIILNDPIADLIREKAKQRGYDNPTNYLLDLVAADINQDNSLEPDNQDISESFKRAFAQSLQGQVISRQEFKRRMAEDE